jgi:hypothetical protein
MMVKAISYVRPSSLRRFVLREADLRVARRPRDSVSLGQGRRSILSSIALLLRHGSARLQTTLLSYGMISRDLSRSLSATAAKPQVARESAYYLANIGNVKSIDDFLGNSRLFNFAMKAYGLEDMAYAKAFVRKVLAEGVDKADSFANTLSDKRYRQLAADFNFARYGETTTVFDRTRQGTVDKYVRQTLEEDAGSENQGVRLALYFQRNAAGITDAYSILADPALLKVVQTALGIPASASAIDIDRQARDIAARLDLDDLKDPEKLGKFLGRFANLWDLENPAVQPAPPLAIGAPTSVVEIGADVLATLQNLRLGGN